MKPTTDDALPELPAVVRPFLKWVGGKGQLLRELGPRIEAVGTFGRYHEPFVGGGALFFHLYSLRRLGRSLAYLSDNNQNLLDAYHGIAENVDAVIAALREHETLHGHDHYYATRAEVPASLTGRAARIIYLNKTCFNGLYRENSKGLFNTPMGRYKKPLICDEPNLRAVAEALRHAKVERRHFSEVLKHAKPGDLVYFDPPYWPVSSTASFTSYAKDNFTPADQEALAGVFATLVQRGVHVMLSNSDTKPVRMLYAKFQIDTVHANRNVNSDPSKRGKINEVLVRSF